MAGQVTLTPLMCTACKSPLQAQPGEVAWACPQCQQGLFLDESHGLMPITINYHAAIPPNGSGLPFWVCQGNVALNRKTYSGNNANEAAQFWSTPRLFFIPAYPCKLEQLLDIGPRLLLQPPRLQNGAAVRFTPASTSTADLQALAEFIVMGIEAGRKDSLRELYLTVNLSTPSLWILPA